MDQSAHPAAQRSPLCATCEMPIRWRPIVIAGSFFGCAGAVVGGPCTHDYAPAMVATDELAPGQTGEPVASTPATWPPLVLTLHGLASESEIQELASQLDVIVAPGSSRLLSFEHASASFAVETSDRDALVRFLPNISGLRIVIDSNEETMIEGHVDRPAIAETVNVIASRFDTFQRLNEFVAEMRTLTGVKDVRLRRLVQGVLHLAIDFESTLPLTAYLGELKSFAVRIGSVTPESIELFVSSVDEHPTP